MRPSKRKCYLVNGEAESRLLQMQLDNMHKKEEFGIAFEDEDYDRILNKWMPLKILIKEYFNPDAYELNELHRGMWVWIESLDSAVYISEIDKENGIITLNGDTRVRFMDDVYYPLTKGIRNA